MDAAKFLHLLFGDATGPDALISVWTLPDKRTRFFTDCDKAAIYAEGCAFAPPEIWDVYFGCGLYRRGVPTHHRGKAADVVGLVGLWADIDFGPNDKGQNHPPDLGTATQIIDWLGVPPSIIVHSGHGLQPWWLFKELLPVADGAAQLAEQWGATIQAVAHSMGYGVDSVWDLARVLRPPGTMNRKAEPVQVTATASEPLLRYEPSYIESMCVQTTYALPVATITEQGTTGGHLKTAGDGKYVFTRGLDLRPGRKLTIQLAQIEQMADLDTRFRATWNRKRKDLPDGSPSGYDMALAHFGASIEWTDQQIADLIYLWRTVRGLDPQKACRPDYIRDTVRKARQRQEEEQAVAKITEQIKAEETPAADDPEDPRRKPILARLQKLLCVPIARWVQYGAADADYTLILTDGREIVIGPVEAVTSQTQFRNAVYQTVGILPTRKKNATWDGICRCLAVIRETVENPEESREWEVTQWIVGWMGAAEGKHVHIADLDSAIEKKAPLRRNGRLHIVLEDLWNFLTTRPGLRNVTKQTLRKALRAAGFTQTVVTPTNRKIKAQRYWRDDKGHFAVSPEEKN